MSEDFINGFNIVPLDANHSIFSSITVSPEHPWKELFQRRDPPPDKSVESPSIELPPAVYMCEDQLKGPRVNVDAKPGRCGYDVNMYNMVVKPQETVRLCDVQSFRNRSAQKALSSVNHNQIDGLSAGLSTSSTTIRPVIYRFTNVIKNSIAVMEAIHFELFLPDRPDLRFLGVQLATVPSDTSEGHYFHITDVDLLANPSFAIKLGDIKYPMVWMVNRMELAYLNQEIGLAYIVKRKPNTGTDEEMASSEVMGGEFTIPGRFFPDAKLRQEHSVVVLTMRTISGAHLYPVEPPIVPRKNDKGQNVMPNEYFNLVRGVRTSSQRRVERFMYSVRVPSASDAAWIKDRLGGFSKYDGTDEVLLRMDQLFRLGSLYRASVSQGVNTKDDEDMIVDESIIFKTLTNRKMNPLDECRTLLDFIYGKPVRDSPADPFKRWRRYQPVHHGYYGESDREHLQKVRITYDGRELELNESQALAFHAYADPRGPRFFAILSPPGSGKTTVAAAMAAARGDYTLLSDDGYFPKKDLQLLLSVQHVAVDNMAAELKKMDIGTLCGKAKFDVYFEECFGGFSVYRMKSDEKLDPANPEYFDFFDVMYANSLEQWRTNEISWYPPGKENCKQYRFTKKEAICFHRMEFQKKYLSPKILLATVDKALKLMLVDSDMRRILNKVTRIIIDEASLLTEAALFAIIRRFPKARIVLIGDVHQLPPFMYDEKILGHELAGRSALNVALKIGRVPVIELTDVYRASPSLVAPYNILSYGGRLVSKKAEGEYPLSDIGLIRTGCAQLLLIDVDGKEQRNEKTKSMYNVQELDALVRLLKCLPPAWANLIMIICLYKEQKNITRKRLRLEFPQVHGEKYTVHTVDSAQGKEKPIVILMTTRTQHPSEFFCVKERCNVAVSRQQNALIILGKESLLRTNYPWSTVVNGEFTVI